MIRRWRRSCANVEINFPLPELIHENADRENRGEANKLFHGVSRLAGVSLAQHPLHWIAWKYVCFCPVLALQIIP